MQSGILAHQGVQQGADCSDAEVGDYLGGVSSGAALGGAKGLLASVAESGGGPGKNENRQESCKALQPGGDDQREADRGTSYGAASGDSANCAAKGGENERNEGWNPEFCRCTGRRYPRDFR